MPTSQRVRESAKLVALQLNTLFDEAEKTANISLTQDIREVREEVTALRDRFRVYTGTSPDKISTKGASNIFFDNLKMSLFKLAEFFENNIGGSGAAIDANTTGGKME